MWLRVDLINFLFSILIRNKITFHDVILLENLCLDDFTPTHSKKLDKFNLQAGYKIKYKNLSPKKWKRQLFDYKYWFIFENVEQKHWMVCVFVNPNAIFDPKDDAIPYFFKMDPLHGNTHSKLSLIHI